MRSRIGDGEREEGRSKKGTKGEEGGEEREGENGSERGRRRTSFTKISVGLADAQRWS